MEGVRNINQAIAAGWTIRSFIYPEKNLSQWAENILSSVETQVNYRLTAELVSHLSGKEDASELMALVEMRKPERWWETCGPVVPTSRISGYLARSAATQLSHSSPRSICHTGIRKKEPMLACITSGSYRSTPCPVKNRPFAPIASQVRSMVPRLPLLLGRSNSTNSGFATAGCPGPQVSHHLSGFRISTKAISSDASSLEWESCVAALRARYPEIRLVGTTSHRERPVYGERLTGPVVIMLGNETLGLSHRYKEMADVLCTIPMAETSSASSLNVGCAASVLLYEVTRQRANHTN